WLEGLSHPGDPLYLPPGGAQTLLKDLQEWSTVARIADHPAVRLCFRLSPPATPEAHAAERPPESQDGDVRDEQHAAPLWRLDYLAQAPDDLSLIAPLDDIWCDTGAFLPMQSLPRAREEALRGLGKAARIFAPIARSLRETSPDGCFLAGAEAHAFLRDA